MPPRNLLIIAIAAIVSVACYSVAARNRYANIFAEALHVVESRALQSMSHEQLFDAAMDGLVSKLDRHSRYLHGDDLKSFQNSIDQHFGGIGVFIGRGDPDGQLTVRAAFPGSPADQAGLESGDVIKAVDGVAVVDLEMNEAIKRMKGEVGDSLKMTVLRGDKTVDISMTREVIDVPSVRGDRWLPDGDWKFTLIDDPRLGYIRIVSFGKETTDEFRVALGQLAGEIDGLIIDLRGNSGGLLDSVIELCDMLLPKELDIVSIRTRQHRIRQQAFKSENAPVLVPSIPIVVLIDRYSASASEIMAGCLQDHGRAVLVGEQTWGKGTVQDVLPIERGQSALKLTTSSYWRPSGKNIDRDFAQADGDEKWGVQPDEGFGFSLEEIEVERNEYYRSEHELRELTGGIKFPRVLLQPARGSELDDSIEVPSDTVPLENDLVEEAPVIDPFDGKKYRDDPFERAVEYLRSIRKKAKSKAA